MKNENCKSAKFKIELRNYELEVKLTSIRFH